MTAKGSSTSPDRLGTFRYSLMWAAVPVALLVIASLHHRPYLMMIAWTGIILLVCLAPVAIWLFDRSREAAGLRREPGSTRPGRRLVNPGPAPGAGSRSRRRPRAGS